MHTSEPGWSASEAVSPNEFYAAHRLRYQRARDVEVELVDWASGKRARGIVFRAVAGAFGWFVVFGMLGAMAAGYGTLSGGAGGDLAELFVALAYLVPLVWIALVLFLPSTETLSEWQLVLDGRAGVAPVAYGVVNKALWSRRVPAFVEPVQRTVNLPEPAVRSFLRVRLHRYEVIVSVFPFGRDLYLGWMLRRREIPITVITRWLRSLVGSGVNYDDLIDMEPIRALREVVHNAVREGIEAAAAASDVPPRQGDGGDPRAGQPAYL